MLRRILVLSAVLAIPLSLIAGPTVQPALAQGGSTAVITPASGPAGSTVTGSGANWTPGDHIQAQWGDDYSNLGSPVMVASDGTFSDSFTLPSNATLGTHQVLFWDQEGRFFEIANFDVTSVPPPPSSCSAPSVSIRPSSGLVGSQLVMAGVGWIPGGVVHITLPYGSRGIFYTKDATPTVSSGGTWQTTVTVGRSPAGSYTFAFAENGCKSKNGTFQLAPQLANPPTLLTDTHLPACILSMTALAFGIVEAGAAGGLGALEAMAGAIHLLEAGAGLAAFLSALQNNPYWKALLTAAVIDPLNNCFTGVQLLLNATAGQAGVIVGEQLQNILRKFIP